MSKRLSLSLIKFLVDRFPSTPKSYLLAGRQVRLGNLLVTDRSPVNVEGELLLHLGPQANPKQVRDRLLGAASINDPGLSLVESDYALRRTFNRVLLVGPANDRNLPKIPPKGAYRIAYYLLTKRDDTDVVIYDPNYWFQKFPDLLKRPYDVVGHSSLFSSFVHDAELMAVLQDRYPAIKAALHVLGGMTVGDWSPETLFQIPVELAVKGLGGERVLSEILDLLPRFQATSDLSLFAPLAGILVRGLPETYGKPPVFYRQEDFAAVVPADFRLVPFERPQDIIGYHGYFRVKEKPFLPLNEVGNYPLHLLSFQMLCQGRCIFCSSQSKHILAMMKERKKSLVRLSPEDLIMLIKEALAANPRIDNIRFDEDNFLFDPKAARRFAELMIKEGLNRIPWKIKSRSDQVSRHPELMEKLREAGCYGVDLGFENGSQRILDLMRKGITVKENRQTVRLLSRLGYEVSQLNYILFNPDSTKTDILETMREMTDYAEVPGVFINLLPYMIALPGAPLMSMPEYQPLITYKEKTLPNGTVIKKPSRLLIRDQLTEEVLIATLGQVDDNVRAYESGSGLKTPEYIYPFIFMKTVYQVLAQKEESVAYQAEVERVDRLIASLTGKTKEANQHD